MGHKFRVYVGCTKRFEWGDNCFDPNMYVDEAMTIGELCRVIEEKLRQIDSRQKIYGITLKEGI